MMHPNGPGFPPMMPFGTDMIPGSGFDNFPRPAAMPCGGPMDLRPHGSALGHSAPHSFHGSQSSVHPEENGMYPQYPPGLRNGAAGPGEDQRGAMGQNIGSLDYGRMGPNPGAPFRDVAAGDHVDALVAHIQRHFSSPELADCCLELRYADDRAPPMRIPGHRLVFSRSLRLAGLVRKQAFQTGPADGAPQTLLLETQSSWVRSDSFYMALQYLYGLPLLQPPSWRDNVNGSEVTSAGSSAIEQFEFAISYAAAGHLLVDNRILARGCEIAAQVLTWQTVELALAFALEKYTDKGSYEAYKYGDGSRVLLNAVVTFIIQHFPPNFSLNADSRELVPFARFPVGLLPSPPTSDAAAQSPHLSSPSEASVHMSRNHKARKLSNIQFGDLPCAEEDETPKPPSPAQPASYSTLSRILLDIPFPQLKMILESPGTGNVHAWANAEARYKIIKSAVDERETRRRRALEAILAGRVPDAGKIREGLRRPEPQDLGPWTAVGWQEDVLPYGNANGPSLGRRWAPIMEPPTGLTSVYP
ncbi:hypothetical protein ESCO_006864 [Escovopsis weberi]|uniref:Uncharacterized protein n=1 Tax=Escovopsis weberi TaxID=150374 RepID=A0A0M9VVR3_ESCWE|nr:hypothetical protein ESCO_006864 [Escovopsis weberi]